eukprot:5608826-Pyramimonas_sp.AAC.1
MVSFSKSITAFRFFSCGFPNKKGVAFVCSGPVFSTPNSAVAFRCWTGTVSTASAVFGSPPANRYF